MSENKVNLIIAVRGYKDVKKQKNATHTDVTAFDNLNNKVLLRIIEPLDVEYIGINDVKQMTSFIKSENYNSAFLISRNFTDSAVREMARQNIQRVSDDYMPPFQIESLFMAIIDCVSNQCMKKCGKIMSAESVCLEKNGSDYCKIAALLANAKCHFDGGSVGLLKNDLKMALALNR